MPDILEPAVTRDVSMLNIGAGWDGFVRLMASVDAGTLSAVLARNRFGSESRADPIHKCDSAMGQLFLTLFLCDFVGKDEFRRELLRILDRGESTHLLLRAIYAGNLPAHRGRRPEELIAISGALTLLSNITIAWMTLHMQEVIDRWKREEGRHTDPELLRPTGPARSEGVSFRCVSIKTVYCPRRLEILGRLTCDRGRLPLLQNTLTNRRNLLIGIRKACFRNSIPLILKGFLSGTFDTFYTL